VAGIGRALRRVALAVLSLVLLGVVLTQHLGPQRAAHFDTGLPERMLAAMCERLALARVSVLPAFRASQASLNFGRGHWNEAGNALAARAIQDGLTHVGALR